MPKEIIHDDTVPSGATNSTPLIVEVQWGRGSDVRIATVDMTKEQYSPESGWFVTVDRSMINKVIRALRRARDQAYGADE